MAFTDIFIRRPVLAMVVSALILLVGARSYGSLAVREFPEMYNTVITVTTAYPGASSDVMQGFITQPLKQAIGSAEGVDYMTSSSSQNQSVITVFVKLNFDPDKALTEVIAKANQVKYLLPAGALDPLIVKDDGGQGAMMYLQLNGTGMAPAAMSDYVLRVMQPMIDTVPGVASIDIQGGQPFAMRLWLDPQKMAAYGVTADDIASAVRTNNFQSAPGQIKGYFTATNVTADTNLSTVEEFRNLVVLAKNDALVHMKDVAQVELGPQSYGTAALTQGQTSLVISITSTPDANPIDTCAAIRKLFPDIRRTLPPGLDFAVAFDTSTDIRASIDEVTRTLTIAVTIVILVIFLFLGSVRSVTIPVVTIPLSMIGTLTIMLILRIQS